MIVLSLKIFLFSLQSDHFAIRTIVHVIVDINIHVFIMYLILSFESRATCSLFWSPGKMVNLSHVFSPLIPRIAFSGKVFD